MNNDPIYKKVVSDVHGKLKELVNGKDFVLTEKDETSGDTTKEVKVSMTDAMVADICKSLHVMKSGKSALEVVGDYNSVSAEEKLDYSVIAYGILGAYSGVVYKDFPTDGALASAFTSHMCTIAQETAETSEYTEEDIYAANIFVKEGFYFGCQDLVGLLHDVLLSLSSDALSLKNLETIITNGTNCKIRDCNSEKYFAEYLDKDLVLLSVLLNPAYRKFENTSFINYLKEDVEIARMVEDSKTEILTNLRALYQDGLGLNPYTGLVSKIVNRGGADRERSSCVITVDPETGEQVTHMSASKAVDGVVDDMLGVTKEAMVYATEKTDRQFNLPEILASKIPLYYPNKLLEFATGRVLTKYNNKYTYEPFVNSMSWEDYTKGYVEKQVYESLLRMAECVIVTKVGNFQTFIKDVLRDKGDVSEYAKIESFNESYFCFLDDYDDPRKLLLDKYVCSNMIADAIYEGLRKLCWAYSVGVIVTRFECLGTAKLELRMRLSSPVRKLNVSDTGMIIKRVSEVKDGFDMTPNTGCSMVEYQHSYRPDITDNVPTWGYKAVELYKARKQALSWKKILLGADEKATPAFAEKKDGGATSKLYFQDKMVHNVIAGSRAGKGVMTMNILVSAAASGKPIFYLDRKPDMASIYYQLTEGNMFIINGGQYDASKDLGAEPEDKKLGDNGVFGRAWQQARFNVPQDIQDQFGITKEPSIERNKFIGDMAYFRAVMLMWGILYARARSDKAKAVLGGSEGLIFVVDEFTNWQEGFENEYLNLTKLHSFTNLAYSEGAEEKMASTERKISTTQKTVDRLERSREALAESNKSTTSVEGQIDAKAAQIEENEYILNKKITPLSVFCRMYIDAINRSFTDLAAARRAGFNNGENRESDIFVIGQALPTPIHSAVPFVPTKEGYNRTGIYLGSQFRYLFDAMPQNWFLGNNTDYNYQGIGGLPAVREKFGKMWWYYLKSSSIDDVTNTKKLPEGGVWFKPNLVLNNNLEPQHSNDKVNSDEAYVRQCMERVTDKLWDDARMGWLDPAREKEPNKNGKTGYLHEGIGLRGLIELVMSTSSNEVFDPTTSLAKSKHLGDSVARAMGYTDYIELLYDFSLEGVFDVEDVLNCVERSVDGNGIGEKHFKSHEFLDKHRERLNMTKDEEETEEFDGEDIYEDYTNTLEYKARMKKQEEELAEQEQELEEELDSIDITTSAMEDNEQVAKMNNMFGSAVSGTFETSALEQTYGSDDDDDDDYDDEDDEEYYEDDTSDDLSFEDLDLLYRAKMRDMLLASNPTKAEAMFNALVSNTELWEVLVRVMIETSNGGR